MLQVEFLNTQVGTETTVMLLPFMVYEKSINRNSIGKQIVIGFVIWAVIFSWNKVIKE